MVGASKILTVSYGTFSCTLEGFDEPFSTMKAIAEYFRDLAADDRYFGAEPPTPDAEMLHKIAEREIHRRVEAKINANGIVLRPEGAQDTLSGAMDDGPTLPNTSRDITVTGASDEELEARGIPARAATVNVATVQDVDLGATEDHAAIVADTSDEVDTVAEQDAPVLTKIALPDAQIAETVAAKLQRIRSAVAEARAREAAAPAFTEDQHADTYYRGTEPQDAAALESDFGFELDITGPIEQDDDEPHATATDAIKQADTVEVKAEAKADAPAVASDAVRTGRTFRIEPKAPPADVPEQVSADESDDESAFDDDQARMERRAIRRSARAEAAAKAQAEVEAQLEANKRVEAETVEAVKAQTDAHIEQSATQNGSDEPATPRIRARVIKVRRSDVEEAAAAYAVAPKADQDTAPVEDNDDPTEASIKAILAAADTRAVPVEKIEPMRVAEVKTEGAAQVRTSDDDDALMAAIAAQIGAENPEPQPASTLTFEDEDALTAELAELERDWSDKPEEAVLEAETPEPKMAEIPEAEDETASETALPLREIARPHAFDDEDEADVSRLMREANTKLEGAENRRRFSAIAHLKAAVAATVADRKVRETEGKSEEDDVDTTEPYRDDLTRAVRPRRPAIAGPATPRPNVAAVKAAPLVLVSEQRVDETPARVIEPVRPRRISAAELNARADADLDEALDDDLETSTEEASDFADFAERLGATGLADLLEAAAAFSEGVEGRPHFSRPQIIRKVAALTGQARYDREAGLRSFGNLLREGKIAKVKRGQFAITEHSRFYKEARRIGA